MEFKRLNKKSKLFIGSINECPIYHTITDIEEENIILQIIIFGNCILIEYITQEEQGNEQKTEEGQQIDYDMENYLETIINKDPFGGKYSGKPIKQVFVEGNKDWLNKALTELKNEFIRERLVYIMAHGGYGKICRV